MPHPPPVPNKGLADELRDLAIAIRLLARRHPAHARRLIDLGDRVERQGEAIGRGGPGHGGNAVGR